MARPHLMSFILLLCKFIKGVNGNDSSSYSHKLHADFKHNFDGNTIETLTENEIYEKHVCKN